MSLNIQPPEIAHHPSVGGQRQPARFPYTGVSHPKSRITGAFSRHHSRFERSEPIQACYMPILMGILVIVAVVAVAAMIMLAVAIRMTHLDDKRARQLPRALPMDERAIRWDDDVVGIEGASGMRERIWWKKLGFGIGRKEAEGSGQEESFGDAVLRLGIENEAEEVVETVQWRFPRW